MGAALLLLVLVLTVFYLILTPGSATFSAWHRWLNRNDQR